MSINLSKDLERALSKFSEENYDVLHATVAPVIDDSDDTEAVVIELRIVSKHPVQGD